MNIQLETLTLTRAEMEEQVCMKNGANTPWIMPLFLITVLYDD